RRILIHSPRSWSLAPRIRVMCLPPKSTVLPRLDLSAGVPALAGPFLKTACADPQVARAMDHHPPRALSAPAHPDNQASPSAAILPIADRSLSPILPKTLHRNYKSLYDRAYEVIPVELCCFARPALSPPPAWSCSQAPSQGRARWACPLSR